VTVAKAVSLQHTADRSAQPYAEAQVAGAPRLQLELALTDEQQMQGLMYRTTLPEDSGMLFVFRQQVNAAFWNHNTFLPLSIAYIGRDGTILDIQDMQAQVEGTNPQQAICYPPARPYWYALEVNQGWYANHDVGVSDKLLLYLAGS
jgi:uncharacterized membrane protein (UPF0127 family)